ncbi:MAG: YlxR family protein [Desulfobulbaceae bacterium]|nr:YlxR family protein [Desulfobulbaceae bacterium]
MCGCRTEKRQLLRFTWRDGRAVADDGRVADGRGAYVCRRDECLETFDRRPERWPRWFKARRTKGGKGVDAGMNKKDAAERRDGSAAWQQ